ncbi:barstar family protein [Nocardioides dubius]|uniref:Barstar (barnase inhibitor) domain-containing protein n=1 Tax=Nocardioides dubius TaxID=317019 RepID=A0ABN1TNN2_9ACTN
MNGLAAVLAGALPALTYRYPAPDLDDLAAALGAPSWQVGRLAGAATKADVLAGLGESLDFGEHYGANLDALADCLADLDGDRVLLWQDWALLAEGEPRVFATVLEILGEHQAAARRGRLLVLLCGEGPEQPPVPYLI